MSLKFLLSSLSFFLFEDLFIYLLKLENKNIYPLIHSLDGHSGQGWAKLKPVAPSRVPQGWQRPKDLGCSAALPVSLLGSQISSGAAGTYGQWRRWWLYLPCRNTVPILVFLDSRILYSPKMMFEESVCQIQVWVSIVFQLYFQGKIVFHEKKYLI